MTTFRRLMYFLMTAPVIVCCAGPTLSEQTARQIMQAHVGERSSINVVGISRGEGWEAIAKLSIDDSALNVKFRHYEPGGWKAESIETPTGTWMALDIGLAQLAEQHRQKLVAANVSGYTITFDTLTCWAHMVRWTDSLLAGPAPRRSETQLLNLYPSVLQRYATYRCPPDTQKVSTDAWGQTFRVDKSDAQIDIRSAGPDRRYDTDDDMFLRYSWVGESMRDSTQFHVPAFMKDRLSVDKMITLATISASLH